MQAFKYFGLDLKLKETDTKMFPIQQGDMIKTAKPYDKGKKNGKMK